MFMGAKQLNVKRIRKADEGEYIPADYLPVSLKDVKQMYSELLALIASVKNPYLRKLLDSYFGAPDFAKAFQFHSAAKSVHHGFVGGLLEHTLSVTKMCDYFAAAYPMLNRDLLLTAAIFHDIERPKSSPYSRRMTIPMTASCLATSSSVPRWSANGCAPSKVFRRSWQPS